jgi:hypothetical protein
MADTEINSNIFDQIAQCTDIKSVTSEGTGSFGRVPDGSYLCSTEKAEFYYGKNNDKFMVKLTLKCVEDGISTEYDSMGNPVKTIVKGSKNRLFYKYYNFTNENQYKSFVSDMMKYKDGLIEMLNSNLEYFDILKNDETISKFLNLNANSTVDDIKDDAVFRNFFKSKYICEYFLAYISNLTVWVQLTTRLKKGLPANSEMTEDNTDQWASLLSWKRAIALGLEGE